MYIAIICIAGMIFQAAFMEAERRERYLPALLFKGAASLIFVTIGIIAYGYSSKASYSVRELTGLVLGAIGDILLNLQYFSKKYSKAIFLTGVLSFFSGHVMYLVALIALSDAIFVPAICGIIFAAVTLAILFYILKPEPVYKAFGILYIGTIFVMCATAVNNFVSSQTKGALLFAAGAILFTVSDVVLIFNIFGDETTHLRRVVNLSCYYVAQLLIASTMFFS